MKFLLATFLLISSPANAQLICDTREKIVTELGTNYNESQFGYGITQSGKQMFELFSSNTGTWTILLTRPNGTTCAMATGNAWTYKPDVAKVLPD